MRQNVSKATLVTAFWNVLEMEAIRCTGRYRRGFDPSPDGFSMFIMTAFRFSEHAKVQKKSRLGICFSRKHREGFFRKIACYLALADLLLQTCTGPLDESHL